MFEEGERQQETKIIIKGVHWIPTCVGMTEERMTVILLLKVMQERSESKIWNF